MRKTGAYDKHCLNISVVDEVFAVGINFATFARDSLTFLRESFNHVSNCNDLRALNAFGDSLYVIASHAAATDNSDVKHNVTS